MINLFKKGIRVAIVAPPYGDTGGPEIVAQNLADALVELGIDVTLFAPADWKTKAKHVATLEKSLWNMPNMKGMDAKLIRNYVIDSQIKVINYQKNFDIVHLHSQRYAYSVGKNLSLPSVLSFHNRFKEDVFGQIKEAGIHTIALSESQRGKMEVLAVIHNGVPVNKIEYSFEKGKYLIFIGRLADQKGVDIAIQIALRADKKLLIFGRKGNAEDRQEYFAEKIEPFLDDEKIIYKGEVGHEEIYKYIQDASALLLPIRRPEVCPMVVGEALACGTPIIGTTIGPLPELLKNKKVAFLSDEIDELVDAAKNTDRFDRKECRKYAEENFDSKVMAKKYLEIYKKILKK